jgi:hypothetical protein
VARRRPRRWWAWDEPRSGGARQRGPLGHRHGVGGERREQMRHRLGIARGAEDPEHATGAHRGEEVLEIQPQNEVPAHVERGVAAGGPTPGEPVRRLVGGDPIQQLMQQTPLNRLELWLGALDQPRRAVAARQPGVVVVAQPGVGDGPLEPACVGQPVEPAVAQLEELRQQRRRVDLGHRPAAPAHRQQSGKPAPHAGKPVRPDVRSGLQPERHEARELARAVGGRLAVEGEDVARERRYPRRAAVEQRLGARAELRLVPGAAGEERVGQAARQVVVWGRAGQGPNDCGDALRLLCVVWALDCTARAQGGGPR